MDELKPYDSREYLSRGKDIEDKLSEYVAQPGAMFIVLSPNLTGKSWLMAHILERQKVRPFWIDARNVNRPADVATQLAKAAGKSPPTTITSAFRLTSFMEELLDEPTCVVWRHADALSEPGNSEREQVRHAIREWSQKNAQKEKFKQLRQSLLMSGEGGRRYYYNNAMRALVTLPDLDTPGGADISSLASKLDVSLSDVKPQDLQKAVGGHIYYLRLALRSGPRVLKMLCKEPLLAEGPFRAHYVEFRKWLDERSRAERAIVRNLLAKATAPADEFVYELMRQGVCKEDRSGIRYGLFEAFVKEYFKT